MSSYASYAAPAPSDRLSISRRSGASIDQESTCLTIFAGILFAVGCSSYLVGTILNLPQIGATDAWMYSAIGAGVFILCGLVEYCNYMGGFHVFLIFAGIFGLVAEVLDGQQHPISVHFNFVANHMYFCEAVKVYYAHAEDFHFMEIAQKYMMIETLKIADVLFVLGTIIDIVLSWIYLFTGTPNAPGSLAITGSGDHLNLLRTDDQKIVEVASASLWFACAILTLIVYIRMARVKASVGEDEEEDEKTKLSRGV
mmetsp:Transcript_11901/g.28498  ORF Transcript_11901/g.28498 Transcript_11901/m.28498 type:complete len:255 (+) Transcript_11901:136-900(+)|eukprot:CAMPEP_0113640208 /NCGR_PEP_ID=MMETSP0017_2-20120614/21101_1 /TAXON_ID=2856 /ORGANISM="Cylindrotheca closterium" /LENGTH=254 /DNA_ID=CAMNT_0000551475 /DNA_START=88 /DNA_END=852 /DNA_ORIENTATION=+ /assembly_acc=CAM_ASM_000147